MSPLVGRWGKPLDLTRFGRTVLSTRLQRLDIQTQWITNIMKLIAGHLEPWFGRYHDTCGPSTKESPTLPSDYGRQRDLLAFFDILQLTHLEYPHGFGDARTHLDAASALAVDYFHGAWRDNSTIDYETCDRARCRQLTKWFDELRMGMMFALLARRSEDIVRLAQFVDVDLPEEEGAWNRTKDDNRTYMVVAAFIRDGSLTDCAELVDTVRSSSKRRPKLILASVEAIAAADTTEFSKELEKLLKMYRDTEFSPRDNRMVASWDATILWNLAGWKALTPDECSEGLMDFVITRKSLGIDD